MRNGFFLTWLRGCMRVTAGPLYGDHFQHKCIIKSTVLLSVIDVAEVLKQKEQWTRHIEGQICTQECTALSVKALQIHIAGILHWNGNVFILMKISSLAAPKVVKMTTSRAASDENLVKMTTFSFQCVIEIFWHLGPDTRANISFLSFVNCVFIHGNVF